ncbi:MAG: hypothetical protein HOW73_44120 [Polyangiaceae bacterium]|nr:hypothetical protein [Polyangiaceae bacterium]
MADLTDSDLSAIAKDPEATGPYLELGRKLKAKRDPRGDLIDVQLELEGARGDRAKDLFAREERLLTDHGDHFYGPAAALAERYRGSFVWRRGFVDQLIAPSEYRASADDAEPMPIAKLRATLDHPSFRLCRTLYAKQWPKRVGPRLESMTLEQAVITNRVLAPPHLRELRVNKLVESVPLSNERLRFLGVNLSRPALEALSGCNLPSLDAMALTELGLHDVHPIAAARVLAHCRARRLFLDIPSRFAASLPAWGQEEFAMLARIGDRIEGLSFGTPWLSAAFPTPNLRRLRLHVRSRGERVTEFDFDTLPTAPELAIRADFHNVDHDALGDALTRSDLAKGLRRLHIEASNRLGSLGKTPLEALEELSVISLGVRDEDFSDRLFEEDVYPNLNTVTIRMAHQLPGLAAAPVAKRLRTLCVFIQGERELAQWRAARPRFENLRTLVVRGAIGMAASVRSEILDLGPDVIWGEHDRINYHRYFGDAGTTPGYQGIV